MNAASNTQTTAVLRNDRDEASTGGSTSHRSDIRELRAPSRDEIRTRYLTITAEQLLADARPLLSERAYELVFDFIANHMLMPVDRAARDHAVELLYEKMKRVHVMSFASNLRESVELIRLANSLDETLVDILAERGFSSVSQIDAEDIDEAMREENRIAERRLQIQLLCNNFRFFHRLAHTPLSRFVLPAMKSFAKAIGVAALVDQIEAGHHTAHSLDDADELVEAIWKTRNDHLDALANGATAA